jgi:hypothetical protein
MRSLPQLVALSRRRIVSQEQLRDNLRQFIMPVETVMGSLAQGNDVEGLRLLRAELSKLLRSTDTAIALRGGKSEGGEGAG